MVTSVAETPAELGLLVNVTASPADDFHRLVYADWLDERGDPRGRLLREFVDAAGTGRPLPTLDGVPAAWADLTGLTVMLAAREAGADARVRDLLALCRPAVRLVAAGIDFDADAPPPAELGTTRLGGDPDLPAGCGFPTDSRGTPLHFLGQFDLAELRPTVVGHHLPPAGLLSIFRTQSDGKNCYPGPEDWPRLVRLTPPGTPLARLPRPTGVPDHPDPYRPDLRLVETLLLPFGLTVWLDPSLESDQRSRLDDALTARGFGTAYVLLGHATHGNTGEEPLLGRPDRSQLVLVPYFEGPDFGISDMSLSYHLPTADLKAGVFDRLEATFG